MEFLAAFFMGFITFPLMSIAAFLVWMAWRVFTDSIVFPSCKSIEE